MEPLAMGATAIGVLLLKKSAETTSERLTQEVLEPILPQIRTAVGALAAPMRDRVAALGDRVAARLPAANLKNPFDDWTLLEAIVLAEAADPATAATVSEVAASLPAINSKIDQQKTGVMFNDPVERVAFELSWQALSQEVQRLAVLLGCFGPAPVLWEWVQGCSLRSLYSLVQAALQQGRAAELSDHPLTQAILKQLTTPPKTP
ncbi:MAG: hypothetical protein BJG00_012345 [Limnothrix sp. CACIAM 69d]|nr:MAG: hypothetical protein BJG00_012345 [Limnothrix sp. CACIAM 69d]